MPAWPTSNKENSSGHSLSSSTRIVTHHRRSVLSYENALRISGSDSKALTYLARTLRAFAANLTTTIEGSEVSRELQTRADRFSGAAITSG